MKKKTVYDFYEDPSHGWIKVHISELIRLGIEDKISGCSYFRNEYAYLEEDCDLSIFFNAKRRQDNIIIRLKEHYTNKSSKIRNYLPYHLMKRGYYYQSLRE